MLKPKKKRKLPSFRFKDHQDKYDKFNSSLSPGPTTIHIPLKVESNEKSATSPKSLNLPITVPQEIQRNSIWQQLHEDGSSTDQLIIPINFKVRQINGSHK